MVCSRECSGGGVQCSVVAVSVNPAVKLCQPNHGNGYTNRTVVGERSVLMGRMQTGMVERN